MSFISNILTPQRIRQIRKLLSFRYKNKIKRDFSLFSNNCWGGIMYDTLGKKYTSPTVGLLLMPNEYITFLENLNLYLAETPTPDLNLQKKEKEHLGLYHAFLKDIDLYFIHYLNIDDGISKWERRKKRIVTDNIIVKFSDPIMDNVSLKEDILNRFAALPYKKIFFTANEELAKKYKDFSVFIKTSEWKNGFDCNGGELKLAKKKYKVKKFIALINS